MESLPLGGRISNFITNWRKITDNDWILLVVEFGYKIPLKTTPFKNKVPKNPLAYGGAHNAQWAIRYQFGKIELYIL